MVSEHIATPMLSTPQLDALVLVQLQHHHQHHLVQLPWLLQVQQYPCRQRQQHLQQLVQARQQQQQQQREQEQEQLLYHQR